MPVRINGATSGYVELAAPAVAGSTSLTLPATSGTLATQIVPACKARRASTQSISHDTWTMITFTSEDFDTDSMFSASDTKITIKTAGLYLINCGVLWAANGTGLRAILIEKNNGGTALAGTQLQRDYRAGFSINENITAFSTVASFAVNDTVSATVYQSSGGALNIGGTSDSSACTFSAVLIGRTA